MCTYTQDEGQTMRKNLYVRDEDAELFDRAEALEGEESLSGVVAKALRDYLRSKEGGQEPETITLHPGKWIEGKGPILDRPISFKGSLIAQKVDGKSSWAIYQTVGGKFVVSEEGAYVSRKFGPANAASVPLGEPEKIRAVRVEVFGTLEAIPTSSKTFFEREKSIAVPQEVWTQAAATIRAIDPEWID